MRIQKGVIQRQINFLIEILNAQGLMLILILSRSILKGNTKNQSKWKNSL